MGMSDGRAASGAGGVIGLGWVRGWVGVVFGVCFGVVVTLTHPWVGSWLLVPVSGWVGWLRAICGLTRGFGFGVRFGLKKFKNKW